MEHLHNIIQELKQKRERVAVEVMKLAKNRHDELLGSLSGELKE